MIYHVMSCSHLLGQAGGRLVQLVSGILCAVEGLTEAVAVAAVGPTPNIHGLNYLASLTTWKYLDMLSVASYIMYLHYSTFCNMNTSDCTIW